MEFQSLGQMFRQINDNKDSPLPSGSSHINENTMTEQGDECYNIEECTRDQGVRGEMVPRLSDGCVL